MRSPKLSFDQYGGQSPEVLLNRLGFQLGFCQTEAKGLVDKVRLVRQTVAGCLLVSPVCQLFDVLNMGKLLTTCNISVKIFFDGS